MELYNPTWQKKSTDIGIVFDLSDILIWCHLTNPSVIVCKAFLRSSNVKVLTWPFNSIFENNSG